MRLAVVLLLVALGCQKSKTDAAPAPTPAKVGSGSGSGSGSGAGSAEKVAPTVVTLPKGPQTAPNKSKQPIDKALSESLAKLTFDSFNTDLRANGDGGFEAHYTTKTRPWLTVIVEIRKCGTCEPMVLDKWKQHEADLKTLLLGSDLLARRPDTTFELGLTDVYGQPVIYSYQFAHFNGKDAEGQQHFSFSNAYTLHYNDHVNWLRVIARYDDDFVDRAGLARLAPRGDLEKMARAFFDVFSHAW